MSGASQLLVTGLAGTTGQAQPGAAVSVAAVLTVVVPAVFAVLGVAVSGRSAAWSREWARTGAAGTLAAACVEAWLVLRDGPVERIALLGRVDIGPTTLALELRADQLSALVAVAVAVVALCVQVYSTGYVTERYPAYAATVSLFTAAMMLVVHADDLVLLLIGWEVMGACSYLLIGHYSERAAARAAAVKAFVVTRFGDLGVLLAIVVLVTAGSASVSTTSIGELSAAATSGALGSGPLTAAALLLLAGVAGKSAQFPLHTWLPDAMEGPTPVSALIHAATMVAAGAFLLARLLPLFLAAPVALAAAAVIASVTMLGAALAALAQDDVKRLLAWSTISQVAYMVAGIAMAPALVGAGQGDPAGAGIAHLLAHAAFKALLFLVAGCAAVLAGSTLMSRVSDWGGLWRHHRGLAVLFSLGLAALAGLPPVSGFWSKEAVLTAAETAARDASGPGGAWPAWLVLASGLLTVLVTGLYAGRAFVLVVLGGPAPVGSAPVLPADASADSPADHPLPASMIWPLWLLAVPTALFGLVLVRPPQLLAGLHLDPIAAVTGAALSLAGVGWALSAPRLGTRDIAAALPGVLRSFLRDGYRLDDVQHVLVVRPYRAAARVVAAGDSDVVDAYPRGAAVAVRWAGTGLRRLSDGLATGYLGWVVVGALAMGLAGVVLS